MKIGYARVSSADQNLDPQLAALREADCGKIYAEKQSGGTTNGRDQLELAIATLRDGDVLVVTKLDRLARSVVDLHHLLGRVTAAGAGFTCLHQASIDTTTSTGKLMLSMLGAFAEFERDLIRERQAEGIARAKARGAYGKGGRKQSVDRAKILELVAERKRPVEIMHQLGCGKTTFYRILEEEKIDPGYHRARETDQSVTNSVELATPGVATASDEE